MFLRYWVKSKCPRTYAYRMYNEIYELVRWVPSFACYDFNLIHSQTKNILSSKYFKCSHLLRVLDLPPPVLFLIWIQLSNSDEILQEPNIQPWLRTIVITLYSLILSHLNNSAENHSTVLWCGHCFVLNSLKIYCYC